MKKLATLTLTLLMLSACSSQTDETSQQKMQEAKGVKEAPLKSGPSLHKDRL